MIHQAVYEHLSADVDIAALTSNIYPTLAPLGISPPFIVFRLDEDAREYLFSGEGAYRKALFAIDVYAKTINSTINIADAVESALTGYTGVMGSTSPQVTVDHVRLERRGPHLHEADTDLFRVPLEFLIGYEV